MKLNFKLLGYSILVLTIISMGTLVSGKNSILGSIAILANTTAIVLTFLGFLQIGKMINKKVIRIYSLLMIILGSIYFIYDAILFANPITFAKSTQIVSSLVVVVALSMVCIYILFAFELLRQRKLLEKDVKAIGVFVLLYNIQVYLFPYTELLFLFILNLLIIKFFLEIKPETQVQNIATGTIANSNIA